MGGYGSSGLRKVSEEGLGWVPVALQSVNNLTLWGFPMPTVRGFVGHGNVAGGNMRSAPPISLDQVTRRVGLTRFTSDGTGIWRLKGYHKNGKAYDIKLYYMDNWARRGDARYIVEFPFTPPGAVAPYYTFTDGYNAALFAISVADKYRDEYHGDKWEAYRTGKWSR